MTTPDLKAAVLLGGKLTRVSALLTLLIGLSVLAGWLFECRPLITVLPGFVAMKPNTAVAFGLGGLSLLFGFSI
ncbi:MAG TPA: hypothetical protein VK474_12695, partial [Chthoniobacterales bacterium]|nr:hypothetical protein [Chthoniobacterales bacterium]